jgi:hypothetical protein
MGGRPVLPQRATKVVRHKTRDKKKLAQIAKVLGIRKANPKELMAAELQTRKSKTTRKGGSRKSRRG